MRKTVAVEDLKSRINAMIENSVPSSRTGRQALAILLESVLMDTGNYHGFAYLRSEYLPADQQTRNNVLREGYDDSRRRYH